MKTLLLTALLLPAGATASAAAPTPAYILPRQAPTPTVLSDCTKVAAWLATAAPQPPSLLDSWVSSLTSTSGSVWCEAPTVTIPADVASQMTPYHSSWSAWWSTTGLHEQDHLWGTVCSEWYLSSLLSADEKGWARESACEAGRVAAGVAKPSEGFTVATVIGPPVGTGAAAGRKEAGVWGGLVVVGGVLVNAALL